MARKAKFYVFDVVGRSAFPIDMMRYDRCTPMTEGDSSLIRRTIDGRYKGDEVNGPFRVTMISTRVPTDDRWASFGWKVENVAGLFS